MKVRAQLLLLLCIFVTINIKAQSLSPNILNTSGGSAIINGFYYDYSFGEMTLIQTFSSSTLIVTQGLLQTKTDTAATGIDDNSLNKPKITVFPNPTQQLVSFESEYQESGKLYYELIDIAGKLVASKLLSFNAGKLKETIDLSNLPAGTFLLKITIDQGKEIFTQTSKIQKTY